MFKTLQCEIETAPFNFGEAAWNHTLRATHLRYRLLPYIYAMAYRVRHRGYTMQRALAFDFWDDPNTEIIANSFSQYMFGGQLLIAPLFRDDNRTAVYLPTERAGAGGAWWDFWSGAAHSAQSTVDLVVPLDEIPVFVKGGSVLVMAPPAQYSRESEWDRLEVRVYGGADGEFVLFEDDFVTRNTVENGHFTLIPFRYHEATRQLTIGERTGSYHGMIENRTFDVVLVGRGHGVGVDVTRNPTASVLYGGDAVTVKL